MGKYFGTDGFRGEANVGLTAEKAYKIGRYLGWYYGKEHADGKARVAIGKDTRRSSYMIEDAICSGLTSSGADAFLLHVTSTPSVSYVARTDEFDCGIMISASHNPFFDNGIKIITADGTKIASEIEGLIESYIDGQIPEIPFALREKIGRSVDYSAGRNRYIGYLMTIPTRAFKNKKIGLDCANGASSTIAKSVFEALGAIVSVINDQPDGVNINLDCGSTHPEGLMRLVKENGLDMGFAYDGDADRCIAVDDKGNLVDGDGIMFVCGKYLKEEGQLKDDTVVTTVMSNLGLYKAFEANGIRCEKVDVGDKYVAACMTAGGYSLGGEQSGHIIFGRYAATGDGVLTSLMVAQAVVEKKSSLSSLAAEMKAYPQCLKNIAVNDKKAAQENPAVLEAVNRITEELGSDGRILLRASGTEPKIRVMVEAKSDLLAEKYVDEAVEVIKSEGFAV